MKEKLTISLQTIAARAGVARSTVSMALRNHPSIPGETCRRIQAIARELGYEPNPVLSSLFSQVRARKPIRVRETLAVITAFPTPDGWRTPRYHIFRDYFDGATERAKQLGYDLEEIWARESGMTGRRLTSILRARNIRGLLIAPVLPAYGHLSLDWSKFASATFGYSVRGPNLSRAVTDHYNNVLLATRQLRRRGYRRIGLLIEEETDERCNGLCSAALSAYQKKLRGSERVPPFLFHTFNESDAGAWLQEHRPDAILANGCPGYVRWVERCGLKVPDVVAVVNLTHKPGNAEAAVDQNGKAIGAAAVDLVVGQLYRNELGLPDFPKLVMIPGFWVDGPTVRPHPRW